MFNLKIHEKNKIIFDGKNIWIWDYILLEKNSDLFVLAKMILGLISNFVNSIKFQKINLKC